MTSLETSVKLAVAISSLELCDRTQVADELLSLSAIYESPTIGSNVLNIVNKQSELDTLNKDTTLRLVLTTTLADSPNDEIALLITIPPSYPDQSPPQLQLKSLYLSSLSVTDDLWSQVLRLYMHDRHVASETDVVEFQPGEVSLFQAIECARDLLDVGHLNYQAHEREVERGTTSAPVYQLHGSIGGAQRDETEDEAGPPETTTGAGPQWRRKLDGADVKCPQIFSTQPIIERKSVFVGHAAQVKSLAEVQSVLSTLLSDKKIAKATHNISAFRFTSLDGVKHADNDDDGETAAGGRLAHLLTLVNASDVLVVVTRWYGGIHLSTQRFQLINQAARDALELGGFLPDDKNKRSIILYMYNN
ncbi:hypothetical protein OIO90_005253 [Microbotryomycetes sp. JL221]|nr:hypothetical protein OIO90_005253 [Microbotryomycetes sp. JL221]